MQLIVNSNWSSNSIFFSIWLLYSLVVNFEKFSFIGIPFMLIINVIESFWKKFSFSSFSKFIFSFVDNCGLEFEKTPVIEKLKSYLGPFGFLKVNKDVVFIIKSTIPIGYTNKLISKFNYKNIIFSPEFLRESCALYDNLLPSRIIVGVDLENKVLIDYANLFIDMLLNCTLNKSTRCLVMGTTEAESVKLFANEYLAMRVSFFNELDTFAKCNNLKTNQIIEGVCADVRIGNYYNNPSFGYGGYCLPKDTKQLLSNFNNIPQNLISAIVQSNDTRKLFIVNDILNKLKSINTDEKVVGIYRLIMKSGSDNFRCSAVKDIMEKLKENNIRIVIYEPTLTDITYEGYEVINDFTKFNKIASIIVANRYDNLLDSDIVDSDKIYSCDIYRRD